MKGPMVKVKFKGKMVKTFVDDNSSTADEFLEIFKLLPSLSLQVKRAEELLAGGWEVIRLRQILI